jgi:hypothetical protein
MNFGQKKQQQFSFFDCYYLFRVISNVFGVRIRTVEQTVKIGFFELNDLRNMADHMVARTR